MRVSPVGAVLAVGTLACGVSTGPPTPPSPVALTSAPLPAVRPPESPGEMLERVREWERRPVEQRRADLHAALRIRGRQHDAYLSLAPIADPSSISVLMLRLCVDYPTPPQVPLGFVRGYECAHGHLVEVLRNVTNQDPGIECADWIHWLAENRHKDWTAWIIDGFAEDEVVLSVPLTEKGFRVLVGYQADRREWRRVNAWRLLQRLPKPELERRLRELERTTDSHLRDGLRRAWERIRK